jgi:carbon monoxide dehydrogenase subunit G
MSFKLSLDVAARPDEVFDFVADFTTMPQWYSAVKQVDRVSGDGGVGTRYKVHRRLHGGPALNVVEITTLDNGRRVTFTSKSGPTPFVYDYRVMPTGATTRLTLEGSISGGGLSGPAALLGPVAESLFKRGMSDNLDELKGILEA